MRILPHAWRIVSMKCRKLFIRISMHTRKLCVDIAADYYAYLWHMSFMDE